MADDLACLLDHLAIERIAVAGVSAGAPHALALAARHPDRVTCVAVASGACPLTPDERATVVDANVVAGEAAEHGWPAVYDVLVELRGRLLREGEVSVLSDAAPEDVERIEAHGAGESRRLREEALRQGAEGWTDETLAVMSTWDFDPEDVTSTVTWWHGGRDRIVPLSAARRLTGRLPDCELIVLPNKGHKLGVRRAMIDRILCK